MCGIIGCILKEPKEISSIIIEGLKSLEYRGYDSWGIAVVDGDIKIEKKVGKIGNIGKLNFGKSRIAVGHTRWATHGGVTQENAHPHLSQNKKIAVVHNGIIENFQELRKFLEGEGFKFKSETDTEVIPHFVEYFLCKGLDFKEACRQTLLKIKGSYAVVIINKDIDYMFAARDGSPLVLGISKEGLYAASDVTAFLNHTKSVIYLDDGEYAILSKDYHIYNVQSNKEIERGRKPQAMNYLQRPRRYLSNSVRKA